MTDIQKEKKRFREKAKNIQPFTDENVRKKAETEIFDNILGLSEYKTAKSIFTYVGFGSEPDTSAFILRAIYDGKTVAVPLVLENAAMEARIIKGLSDLKRRGSFGIQEPSYDTGILNENDIDLVIVPGMYFDAHGHRLGRGAGFYDRYLKNVRAYLAGVCFSVFITELVPYDIHDVKMNAVISEKGVAYCT